MLNINDEKKSIEELKNDFWPLHSKFPTPMVERIYFLRRKPVSNLNMEDIRLLVSQNVGLQFLMPKAIDLLETDVLQDAMYYPGDFLLATLGIVVSYWQENTNEKRRFNADTASN